MSIFSLETGRWYACDFIGDEFDEDKCSYSPIKLFEVTPLKTGKRRFRLRFYHANYPVAVQENEYILQTIERDRTFMLANSHEHDPRGADLQEWIDRNV